MDLTRYVHEEFAIANGLNLKYGNGSNYPVYFIHLGIIKRLTKYFSIEFRTQIRPSVILINIILHHWL